MVSRAFAALEKKRASLAEKEKGFTLIELLVVVIIIGVLAAIAIPVYLNVQASAKDSAVQSDLTNAKTAVVSFQTTKGKLPTADEFKTMPGYTLPAAGGNYATAPAFDSTTQSDFCISAKSTSDKTFAIDAAGSVLEGTCVSSKAVKKTT